MKIKLGPEILKRLHLDNTLFKEVVLGSRATLVLYQQEEGPSWDWVLVTPQRFVSSSAVSFGTFLEISCWTGREDILSVIRDDYILTGYVHELDSMLFMMLDCWEVMREKFDRTCGTIYTHESIRSSTETERTPEEEIDDIC